ncbi:MAG: hypothetical protein P8Y42_02905 [Exilibacterium sp.]
MAILDLFSKRQKRSGKGEWEGYTYSELPQPLRVQIVHIWHDTLGGHEQFWSEDVKRAYEAIVNALCREYGLFKLPSAKQHGERDFLVELTDFFLQEVDLAKALDVVEISFKTIDSYTRRWEYLHRRNADELAGQAISELNTRFNEHGVGYQFIQGKILKIDSEFVHEKIVTPALQVFNNGAYYSAQQHFARAYELYRHGESSEAFKVCVKTFEDMMKTICDRRNWGYSRGANIHTLIDVCVAKKLINPIWQEQLKALGNMLEQGRRLSSKDDAIPDYLVSHTLNLAASTLLCLAEAEESERMHNPKAL